MVAARKEVRVAIVGLGRVGSTFLSKLASREDQGVKVVAVAEKDENAQGVMLARSEGITVYQDAKDIVAMGEAVDIIFDLTGVPDTRKVLRVDLARSGNQHTVVAPEVIAYLIWNMMGNPIEFPDFHDQNQRGY